MHTIFKGADGKYGICEGNAVMYEADFPEATARRIAELVNSEHPPKDWEETKALLLREGFAISTDDLMKRPRVAQLYVREPYWRAVEGLRTEKGLPEWAFDFISVHGPYRHGGKYSLVAPMCLVDHETGTRPDFEDLRYDRKQDAIKEARRFAREKAGIVKVHVVVVPEEVHRGR